jgi:hypothetical protein
MIADGRLRMADLWARVPGLAGSARVRMNRASVRKVGTLVLRGPRRRAQRQATESAYGAIPSKRLISLVRSNSRASVHPGSPSSGGFNVITTDRVSLSVRLASVRKVGMARAYAKRTSYRVVLVFAVPVAESRAAGSGDGIRRWREIDPTSRPCPACGVCASVGPEPSPDAALGDGDLAARGPYLARTVPVRNSAPARRARPPRPQSLQPSAIQHC